MCNKQTFLPTARLVWHRRVNNEMSQKGKDFDSVQKSLQWQGSPHSKEKRSKAQVCKWNSDFLHLAITLQERNFSFASLFPHKIKFHVNFKTFKHPETIMFSFCSFFSFPCVPLIFQIFTHALHKLQRNRGYIIILRLNVKLPLSSIYTWHTFKLPSEITSLFYVLMYA